VKLGRRRAEKVMGRLTGLVGGGDIDIYQRMTWSVTSLGRSAPRSSVAAQNRRVEIFIDWGKVKTVPPPPPPPNPKCTQGCESQYRNCLDNTRFPPECLARRGTCLRAC
jgi:hypothetical protein